MSATPTLEQLKAFFHAADQDGSGALTYQELSTALRSQGYTCPESELQVKYTLIKNSQQLYDLRDTPVLSELQVKYTLIKNSQQLYFLRDTPVLGVNYR